MSALIIGLDEQAAIAAAVAKARAAPIATETLASSALTFDEMRAREGRITLADRPRTEATRRPLSEHVRLPLGYRMAISFERQPCGLCAHLSLSIDRPGRIPRMVSVALVAHAAGFDWPPVADWIEEFQIDGKPGGHAVNVLFLVE